MSAPFGPYALTLDDITRQMCRTFETFIDPRKGKNKSYTMVDAALSAFSVFFTQSPSFLEHQRSLEQTQGSNNARTLFGVHEIPSDNHIRSLLDATLSATLKPVYAFLFNALEQIGVVDPFRSVGGARCWWPSTGRSISPRRPSTASAARRGGTPTALPSRKRLFNEIRTLTSYLCFETWENLTDFMLKSFEPPTPKLKAG